MQRREFLRRLRTPAFAVAAVPAAAMALADRGADTARSATALLKKRMGAMEDRLDNMEASHKRTIKVLTALTGLSLGLDLSAFL